MTSASGQACGATSRRTVRLSPIIAMHERQQRRDPARPSAPPRRADERLEQQDQPRDRQVDDAAPVDVEPARRRIEAILRRSYQPCPPAMRGPASAAYCRRCRRARATRSLPWRCHRYQATTPSQKTSIPVSQRRSSSSLRRNPRYPAQLQNRFPRSALRIRATPCARASRLVTAFLHRLESMMASGLLGQLIRFGIAGGISTGHLRGRLLAARQIRDRHAFTGKSRGFFRRGDQRLFPPQPLELQAAWRARQCRARRAAASSSVSLVALGSTPVHLGADRGFDAHRRLVVAADSDPVRHAARHFRAQSLLGIRLIWPRESDGPHRLRPHGGARHHALVVPRAPRHPADYIARWGDLPKDARILEIGCGTGHNLPMLAAVRRGRRDRDRPAARAIASERLGKPVGDVAAPRAARDRARRYDMIAVLDVVEHIEDDVAALRRWPTASSPAARS